MDATIIDAPKSTKNAEASRDPEMHRLLKPALDPVRKSILLLYDPIPA